MGPLSLPRIAVAVLGVVAAMGTAGGAAVEAVAEPTTTERLDLSGRGMDDAVSWEFKVSAGRRAGEWSTLPVPSCWELHGFGTYNYGHDEDPSDEVGSYRHEFLVPPEWAGRVVELVFDGVMTDAAVRLNGRDLTPTHRGAFYPFRYRVDELLELPGLNLLEVEVAKRSADRSVNLAERDADYWVFGGIFRPVWLEAHPRQRIVDAAVDARADGRLSVSVETGGVASGPPEVRVEARVETEAGEPLGGPLSAKVGPDGLATVVGRVAGVEPWSAERPRLYRLRLRLVDASSGLLHRTEETIGFRTVEVRPGEGLYVNGVKVMLWGVNRHAFWPDAGRTTSPAVSALDVALIRGANLNAVRTSHYPPDRHFLEEADRRGLYVIDELAGWHDAYETELGAGLVRAMVRRDRNHPSVVLWANGNEDGWNPELDDDFARHDPQGRTVIHPRSRFGGFQTRHYPNFRELRSLLDGTEWRERWEAWRDGPAAVMPTEALHGLYDGGQAAGLEAFARRLEKSERGAGLFLWSLFDEAVVRSDRDGALDTDGNQAADGLSGPYRQPEASYDAVREILSPVRLRRIGGKLEVENRYAFTDLATLDFRWRLLRFPEPGEGDPRVGPAELAAGSLPLEGAPGEVVTVALPRPELPIRADLLAVSVADREGRLVVERRWPLVTRRSVVERWIDRRGGPAPATLRREEGRYVLTSGEVEVRIDAATARLQALVHDGHALGLAAGPRPLTPTGRTAVARLDRHRIVSIEASEERSGAVRLRARGEGAVDLIQWRLYPSGWLQLTWQMRALGRRPFVGVGFDLPEESVEALTWLGPGPWRIWNNRTAGVPLGLWRKTANDTVTGQSWEYPEFRGYHAPPWWATVETTEGDLTIVFGPGDLHLQLLAPTPWDEPRQATAPFPDAGLGFLETIPAMGTKFHASGEMGPAFRPTGGHGLFRGEVYLRPAADLESPTPEAQTPETQAPEP